MKIISKDHDNITLKAENNEDLWTLSQIIIAGDIVFGETFRKIKIGGEEDRKSEVIKKKIHLSIITEKIEHSQGSLRVLGTVAEGLEDIPKGSHHTISIEPGSIVKITKEWNRGQIERINRAAEEKPSKILICVFDREDAYFALLKSSGHETISKMKGEVQKKEFDSKPGNFFADIAKELSSFDQRYVFDSMILASPAFWKEELSKHLTKEVIKKSIFATCSSATESAIQEVMKRDELKQALKNERMIKESSIVEDLFSEIAKDGLACYGIKETKEALSVGAVKTIIITDSLLEKMPQIEELLSLAESTKADIFIVSGSSDPAKRLDALSGIGALLRFKHNI